MFQPRRGLEVIGWKGCAKQRELGPQGFPLKTRSLATHAEMAQFVPKESADEASAVGSDRKRQLQQYREIRQGAAEFAQGTPECPKCPLSGGQPYGCYQFVRFPIDEVGEKTLFAFFMSQVEDDGSTCSAIFRDVVSKQPMNDEWHTDRGAEGRATLAEPLEHKWGFILMRKRADSAQLLASVFFSHKRMGLITVFSKFWTEMMNFARARAVPIASSQTMMGFASVQQLYSRVEEICGTQEGVAVLVDEV